MKAEFQFVANNADYFVKFTEKFHRDEPLIHLLFAEPRELILVLSGHISDEKKMLKQWLRGYMLKFLTSRQI